jgi:alpha-galactosidase
VKRRAAILLAVIFIVSSMAAALDHEQAPVSTLAGTPPMGWNSWNTFGCDVSEDLIRQVADAMVTSGMTVQP